MIEWLKKHEIWDDNDDGCGCLLWLIILSPLIVAGCCWFAPFTIAPLFAALVYTVASAISLMPASAMKPLVQLRFENATLTGVLDVTAVRKRVSRTLFFILLFGAGVFVTTPASVLIAIYQNPQRDISLLRILFCGVVSVTASLIVAATLHCHILRFLIWWLNSAIKRAARPINDAYHRHGIREIDASIAEHARLFEVSWLEYGRELACYIINDMYHIFHNKAAVEQHVAQVVSLAQTDLNQLRYAQEQRDQFVQMFDPINIIVNKTGQIGLIREMDELFRAVHSKDVSGYLVDRDWAGYAAIMRDIKADLSRIERDAKQISAEDGRGDSSSSAATPSSHTVEWSYERLGLDDTASNEQIKAVYGLLPYPVECGHFLTISAASPMTA